MSNFFHLFINIHEILLNFSCFFGYCQINYSNFLVQMIVALVEELHNKDNSNYIFKTILIVLKPD